MGQPHDVCQAHVVLAHHDIAVPGTCCTADTLSMVHTCSSMLPQLSFGALHYVEG